MSIMKIRPASCPTSSKQSANKNAGAEVLALSTLTYHTDLGEPKPILARSWVLAEGKKHACRTRDPASSSWATSVGACCRSASRRSSAPNIGGNPPSAWPMRSRRPFLSAVGSGRPTATHNQAASRFSSRSRLSTAPRCSSVSSRTYVRLLVMFGGAGGSRSRSANLRSRPEIAVLLGETIRRPARLIMSYLMERCKISTARSRARASNAGSCSSTRSRAEGKP